MVLKKKSAKKSIHDDEIRNIPANVFYYLCILEQKI